MDKQQRRILEILNQLEKEDPSYDWMAYSEVNRNATALKYSFDYLNKGADSVFILLINGLNDGDEIDMVKQILLWKEFVGKKQTNVKCSSASDHMFIDRCRNVFGKIDLPILIVSDTPEFEDYLKVNRTALVELSRENKIEHFLNELHGSLRINKNLRSIKRTMNSKKFWKVFFSGYKEIKSLVSFKGTANID